MQVVFVVSPADTTDTCISLNPLQSPLDDV